MKRIAVLFSFMTLFVSFNASAEPKVSDVRVTDSSGKKVIIEIKINENVSLYSWLWGNGAMSMMTLSVVNGNNSRDRSYFEIFFKKSKAVGINVDHQDSSGGRTATIQRTKGSSLFNKIDRLVEKLDRVYHLKTLARKEYKRYQGYLKMCPKVEKCRQMIQERKRRAKEANDEYKEFARARAKALDVVVERLLRTGK